MFTATRYIAWAMQFYGRAPYDLATSGIPLVGWSDIDRTPPADRIEAGARIDDLSAYGALRAAIARYNDVPVSEVTPALGTSNGIFLAYAATLSAGDEILVEAPGYEPLTRAAEGLGVTVTPFPRFERDDFAIVPERVAALVSPRTRAIVVTTLHNPSGVRIPDATLRELAQIADARGAHLIVDEVYAPFDRLADNGVFPSSARKLAPNIIAISSLTKCYGLGMYRVGWLLAAEDVTERAAAASVATIGHLPLAHASNGVVAFEALPSLSKRARTLFEGKRAIAEAWARSLRDAHWSAPAEGLFGLVTLHGRGDLRARIEACAEEAGVLVGAGSFFGAPESFRLSWANTDVFRFREALDRLATLVK